MIDWEELRQKYDTDLEKLLFTYTPPQGEYPLRKWEDVDIQFDKAIQEITKALQAPENSPKQRILLANAFKFLFDAARLAVEFKLKDGVTAWGENKKELRKRYKDSHLVSLYSRIIDTCHVDYSYQGLLPIDTLEARKEFEKMLNVVTNFTNKVRDLPDQFSSKGGVQR